MTPTRSAIGRTTNIRTRNILPRFSPRIREVGTRRVSALTVQISPCGFRVSFSNHNWIGEIDVLDWLCRPRWSGDELFARSIVFRNVAGFGRAI